VHLRGHDVAYLCGGMDGRHRFHGETSSVPVDRRGAGRFLRRMRQGGT
jgi:hypothetical protein